MEWYQFISAAGLGAIGIKLIDILWLQRVLQQAEKKKWIREQRLRVYSNVAKEALSLGKASNTREDPFAGYALAAEAMLLTDDLELSRQIELFFTKVSNLYAEGLKQPDDPTCKPEHELEGAYNLVRKESRELVEALRKSIVNT